MAEVFVLHYSADSDDITIRRPDGHPSTCRRDVLSHSTVMAQLLSSAVESGSDGITSHAPQGLLSPFLEVVCGQQDICGMDTASLIHALEVCRIPACLGSCMMAVLGCGLSHQSSLFESTTMPWCTGYRLFRPRSGHASAL